MGDDRKRRQSEYGSLPQSKRSMTIDKGKNLDDGDDDEDESFKAGVKGIATFQKKRLLEKIAFLEKTKLKEKDDEIQKLRDWKSKYYSVLTACGSNWDQLNQDISLIMARFDKDPISSAILQETGSKPGNAARSFLERLNIGSDKYDEKTEERITYTKKIISRLVHEVDRARRANDALYDKLRERVEGSTDEIVEELRGDNAQMHDDRSHLEEQLLALQEHMTSISMTVAEHQEIAEISKARAIECQEDLDYTKLQNEILHQKIRKLRGQVNETEDRVRDAIAAHNVSATTSTSQGNTGSATPGPEGNELQQQLDEALKISQGRLKEIEQLREERVKDRIELDRLHSICIAPVESPQYKILQTQYALCLRELQEVKASLETAQKDLSTALLSRRTELEHLESSDREFKTRMEEELRQAESRALLLMNERDSLQLQLEKQPAGPHQDGLMTEMRQLIIDLQNHNSRQKKEIRRYKQKNEELRAKGEATAFSTEEGSTGEACETSRRTSQEGTELQGDLKDALKKAEHEKRDLLNQIEALKKEVRSPRAPNLATTNEKKLQEEVARLRDRLRGIGKTQEGGDRKLEQSISELQSRLQSKDQEEAALVSEMEVIGSAYEAMQEQNARLQVQLQQKEDANFHLMSQQIKSNQVHQLLKEERESLEAKVTGVQSLYDTTANTLHKMEEKERNLREQLCVLEKDQWLKQQALDLHRKKAIEAAQDAKEKGIQLQRTTQQVEEMLKLLNQKTEAADKDAHVRRRLEEDKLSIEARLKIVNSSEDGPSALLEEEIRQYKEMVNCSLCKRRRKNGVITKCFHSFCLQCVQ
eukprot:Ihof_evm1s430 gene=Ihof_evmTU1s430